MSKEKNRGHREAKKPKKAKEKVPATAHGGTDNPTKIAGKTIK